MRLFQRRSQCEDGAVLLITLGFLTFVGLTIAALLNYSIVNLASTSKLRVARNLEYDVDNAMETAIAQLRVAPASGAAQGYVGSCSPIPVTSSNNVDTPLRVECSPIAAPVFQREVILSVYPSSTSCPCADAQALLQADVKFYDDGTFGRAVLVQTWSAR